MADVEQPPASPRLPQPPNAAARWVRYLVAFGVSVAVGLAPLLGAMNIPGFRALLTLFPRAPFDSQDTVVPLAAFLMGVVAVGVQFYSRRRPEWSSLGSVFKKLSLLILVSIVLLLCLHVFTVEQVSVEDGEKVSVLLGVTRPNTCRECTPSMSNAECLEHTTLNPGRILSCWSEIQIKASFLGLAIIYLTILGSFGAFVGVLVLQEPPARGQLPQSGDSARGPQDSHR